MNKEKLSVKITFRMSASEYAPYEKLIKETGIKPSALFREVFIAKSGCMVAPKEPQKDKKRLLFLASKASNNINQIAHKLNSAYRADVISDRIYKETLNNLISIEQSFAGAIKKC
jgi:hypothetical protein